MYVWWLWAHIASVFGFLLSHGVSVGMGFDLRRQKAADAVKSMTEVSKNWTGITYAFLVLILITGVAMGFQQNWWRFKWIWTAIAILILTMGAMAGMANRYNRIRSAAGVQPPQRQRQQPAENPEDLMSLVAAANPWPISIVGIVALILLLWLMVLKPF
ncbi:MAG TPA: hypothetical protein VIT43_01225 [Candidatus Dormibacteraeota bacterium]